MTSLSDTIKERLGLVEGISEQRESIAIKKASHPGDWVPVQCIVQRLSFLPEVAARFHALMMAPGPGECLGTEVSDPHGLILDPTVDEAKAAIKTAYDAAARDGDH